MSSSASRVWMTTGRPQLARQPDLRAEDRLLHVARREVVVVVEADLADAPAPAACASSCRRTTSAAASGIVGELVRLVRVDADREPDVRPQRATRRRLRDSASSLGREDDQRALDARRRAPARRRPRGRRRTPRRRDGSGCRSRLRIEWVGWVAVYGHAVPGVGGSTSRAIGLPPSGLAASTMPFDSMPISFAGFRLATITTVRPTSASGS